MDEVPEKVMRDAETFVLAFKHARDQGSLPMMVVYDHPDDFPEHYVARAWLTIPCPDATPMILRSKDINLLRPILRSMGLVKMTRAEGDDPKILETWI